MSDCRGNFLSFDDLRTFIESEEPQMGVKFYIRHARLSNTWPTGNSNNMHTPRILRRLRGFQSICKYAVTQINQQAT